MISVLFENKQSVPKFTKNAQKCQQRISQPIVTLKIKLSSFTIQINSEIATVLQSANSRCLRSKKWNGKSKSFSKVLIENAYYFSAPLFFEGIEDVITQSFDATLCHKPQVVKQYEKILKVYSSIYQLGLPADEEFPKSINSECEGNAKIPMWSTNSEKCFYEKCLIMHALYDVTHQVKHQNFHHREKRDEIKSSVNNANGPRLYR